MGIETAKRVARRPKSYRGCKACKSARKKCSEAKPECAFCIRNGLKCEYDIDFVLRFETFVDGKQPRRRASNKPKGSPGRKLSGDAVLSDDNSTIPSTPMTLTPDLSDHAIDSDVDTKLISRTDTPESPDSQDLCCPEVVLFTRYPQLFEHDPDDSPYMDYFRCEVKVVLPYFEIFPSMVTDILCRAATDRGLLHTVLSVSHLIADSRLHRSLLPAFQHQTEALSLLQQQISATDITEALAISVAMLAWLNISRCNRPTLNQHLHGLYLIFKEIQTQGQPQSPLLKQIWRFSIRLDLLATTLFFPRTPLFHPVSINEDHLHREWVRLSTETDLDTEWTLASFALDNLMHRATHVAMKVYELRKQYPEQSSIQISKWIQSLLLEHSQWCTRPLILQAQRCEREVNEQSPTSEQVEGTFLDYSPLQIRDKFYSNLLNTWRAIYIFIDLIATPEIGPSTNPKRLSYAVDICRTYAALGRDDMFPIGKAIAVFLAGVAFGGKRTSPREVGWLYDSMVTKLQEYFPLNRTAVIAYQNLWEVKGNYWDALENLNAGLSLDSML